MHNRNFMPQHNNIPFFLNLQVVDDPEVEKNIGQLKTGSMAKMELCLND